MKRALSILSGAAAATSVAYLAHAVTSYFRYGRTSESKEDQRLIDHFLPEYKICERHSVRVDAPAEVTLAAARAISFYDSAIIRSILALRSIPSRLSGNTVAPLQKRPIMEEVVALGWRKLAEDSGRQVVMGAVTQPWEKEVVFHGLAPEAFVAFQEPGYAKICWTLEVERTGPSSSVFSTETRVRTTDPASREKFRCYWSFLSPGIIIIRREALRLIKKEAERRVRLR